MAPLTLLPIVAVLMAASPAPDTDTEAVQRGSFEVLLDLDGTFDAPDAHEVTYRPEVYTGPLVVVEAAQPGPVVEGQVLVKLDTEKIDEQIELARMDLELARAKLKRTEVETRHEEEATAIVLANAQMAYENAKQKLETFQDVLMPMRIAEAELGIQASKDRMKEDEERYVQLEKMYKDDDLVEETEEIVLGREKRSLEQSRKRLTFTLQRHELFMEVDLPRELQGYQHELRKATNDWELTQVTAGLGLERKRDELEKAAWELARQERELTRLMEDHDALTVRAPLDGVAVPGQFSRGKWTKLDETARSLRVGEKLQPGQVLFTIVQPGPRRVRTTVPEDSVLSVRAGQSATVAPAAAPDSKTPAKVTRVARVSTDGRYAVWLDVEVPDSRLIAGNACGIELKTAELSGVLSVPSSAVATSEGRSVVHVRKDDGTEEREVRVGATSRGRTAVLAGLEEGERVLRTPAKR